MNPGSASFVDAARSFVSCCVGLDLEVSKKSNRIMEVGAAQGLETKDLAVTPATLHLTKSEIPAGINKLDAFCRDSKILVGHNVIEFDLPHLVALSPRLSLHEMPVLDSLQLNPLAFPRNPYHHLVKHYQDGQLKSGRLNDPELDARITLDLFYDQIVALRKCNESSPELILAWHWLTTGDKTPKGLNTFFSSIRRKPRPS